MGFELTILVVIDTNCIGSSKSNYGTITTTRSRLLISDYKEHKIYMCQNNWNEQREKKQPSK